MGSTAKDGEHSRGGAVGPGMVELKSPPHFFYAESGDDEMGNKSPLSGPSWSFSGTSLSLWANHVIF